MQVRKFEAKTIKEAIELVKFHMGPDAIILSAKDNNKGFGLMGETSVEVTAAVSESKLNQKKMAEKKLDDASKKRYLASSARVQKDFISKSFAEKSVMNFIETEEPRPATPVTNTAPRTMTSRKYIEIDDQISEEAQAPVAAIAAAPRPASTTLPSKSMSPAALEKIASLQNEIQTLKGMLANFQNVPQNFLSLHPGAEDGLPYELSFIFKKLQSAGMAHNHIVNILKTANEVLPDEHKKKKAFVDGWVIKFLLEQIQVVEKPFKNKYQLFIGPTGQGKTSSVVKMACHLLLKEKKRIAILSGDHVKVGAQDQLKIYAQILNVPCGSVRSAHDWAAVQNLCENVDYVLLDTPGVNLKGANDLELIRTILPMNVKNVTTHFVQSIMARDVDAFEIADRFQIVGFDDVIFTRLDEAVQHGLIYNFQQRYNVPLHSFGIGNTIPDDYELATKERVIDLIFNLTKIRKERGPQ